MKRRTIKLLLLALAPLLTAFHCKSIHPSFPSVPACGGFKDCQQSVEPLLQEAHANSVLALGISNWDVLEPCNRCIGPICLFTPWPPGYPELTADRHQMHDGFAFAYRCNFNSQLLDEFLSVHVDPAPPQRPNRRHFMVQLAPIFHTGRTMPRYLAPFPPLIERRLNAESVRARYRVLLDKMVPMLAEHAAGTVVAIGVGNEVNAYLNNHPLRAWENLWEDYADFVQDAMEYIHTIWPGPGPVHATFSTQWYSFCGLGNAITLGNLGCIPQAVVSQEVMAQTDVLAYTYYPHFENDGEDLAAVSEDLGVMRSQSIMRERFVVIQETGYPDAPIFEEDAPPQATQLKFVEELFAAREATQDRILGLNYFTLHDFFSLELGVEWTTGLFTQTAGVAKANGEPWELFKAEMAD